MTEVREAPGTPAGAASDPEINRQLMEDMLVARRASERLWNLQRQGRIATIPPLTGQEAAIVGVVRALDLDHDWLAPYYREPLGMAALGDEFLEQVVLYWRGHPDGGRIPDGVRCLPPQISLGAQVPHAAGIAWGLKLLGEPGVACTFIGDGATSEGDFYEGLNLAGVQHLPLLVVVLNNGWAISTPTRRQTAASTFAAKADAVGIPGVRVDGNDVLAVGEAARAARGARSRVTAPRCSSSSPTGWARTPTPTTPRATCPSPSWPSGGSAIRSIGSGRASPKPGHGTTPATRHSSTRWKRASSASSTLRSHIRSTRTPRSTTAPPTTTPDSRGNDASWRHA